MGSRVQSRKPSAAGSDAGPPGDSRVTSRKPSSLQSGDMPLTTPAAAMRPSWQSVDRAPGRDSFPTGGVSASGTRWSGALTGGAPAFAGREGPVRLSNQSGVVSPQSSVGASGRTSRPPFSTPAAANLNSSITSDGRYPTVNEDDPGASGGLPEAAARLEEALLSPGQSNWADGPARLPVLQEATLAPSVSPSPSARPSEGIERPLADGAATGDEAGDDSGAAEVPPDLPAQELTVNGTSSALDSQDADADSTSGTPVDAADTVGGTPLPPQPLPPREDAAAEARVPSAASAADLLAGPPIAATALSSEPGAGEIASALLPADRAQSQLPAESDQTAQASSAMLPPSPKSPTPSSLPLPVQASAQPPSTWQPPVAAQPLSPRVLSSGSDNPSPSQRVLPPAHVFAKPPPLPDHVMRLLAR